MIPNPGKKAKRKKQFKHALEKRAASAARFSKPVADRVLALLLPAVEPDGSVTQSGDQDSNPPDNQCLDQT